mgnify:CR=1 FL=1
MNYVGPFDRSVKPVNPGFYNTRRKHEVWDEWFNYWNGTEWKGVIKKEHIDINDRHHIGEAKWWTDLNIDSDWFEWRGVQKV